MKKQMKCLGLLIVGMTFTLLAYSQKPVDVNVISEQTNNSEQPYFIVEIPQASVKTVKNNWQKYVSKSSIGKATVLNEEYIQMGAVNTNISTDPFTSYGSFSESMNGVQVKVWLKQNNLPFPAQGQSNASVIKFVHDFAVAEYRNAVNGELTLEQKKLDAMEKRLAAIDKAEDKSLRDIGKNARANERSKSDVKTNNTDIENSSGKIDKQKGMVDSTASDRNANRGANKTLREMERDKKASQRDNEKQGRNTDKRDQDTREQERNIAAGKQERQALQDDIEKQKQVVLNVQTKLENIN